jgi:anaerobic selenocysteine-containing dehydrogenase
MSKDDSLSWGKSTVESACPLDCPDNCSLQVSVESGRVTKIDGASDRHGLTNGFICAKVRGFADRLYGDDRLLHPAVRKGPKGKGQFERVTWDEAMTLMVSKIEEVKQRAGAEAILPLCYGGSNGLLTQDTADEELFRSLGASRLARTVCAAATGAASAALYGKMPGVSYEDYVHARLIVVWGSNPHVSSIHLVPHVRAAQRRGATLIVVDPRRTPLARQADLHIPLRPGTDLPVALALHRYLFEEGLADAQFLAEHTTGSEQLRARAAEWTFERAAAVADIDRDDLEKFARLYATLSPAVIRCGWGQERNRNGGHATMAVLGLPAVAGKFGVRGGGFSLSNSRVWRLDANRWIDAKPATTRIVNMNQVGRVLTEPQGTPIDLLFVYNNNPVATLPDQNRLIRGLMREDLFTVVFDQVKTDTAMYADLVLPATTFLEAYDLTRAYGSYALQLVRPAIEPLGEARSNMDVFSELGVRLGLREEIETDVEALLRVASHLPDETRETLMDRGIATPPSGTAPIQFVDLFPETPDRKVRLYPEQEAGTTAPDGLYSYQPDPATAQYPLALVSPASDKTISSMLGELRTRMATLYMHPRDASARDLADGDAVRVFNALGEVHCLLHVGEDISPGTVSLPKGLWRKSTLNQSTSNALVPDTLTDVGAGACFNDARVEVARILDSVWEGKPVTVYVPTPTDDTDTVH